MSVTEVQSSDESSKEDHAKGSAPSAEDPGDGQTSCASSFDAVSEFKASPRNSVSELIPSTRDTGRTRDGAALLEMKVKLHQLEGHVGKLQAGQEQMMARLESVLAAVERGQGL